MARSYKRDKIGRFSFVSGGKGKSNSRKKSGSRVARHAGMAAQEGKTGNTQAASKAAGQGSQKKTGSSAQARTAARKGRETKTSTRRG